MNLRIELNSDKTKNNVTITLKINMYNKLYYFYMSILIFLFFLCTLEVAKRNQSFKLSTKSCSLIKGKLNFTASARKQ